MGSMISSGCKWAMLMVLTKFVAVEMVGHYVLALSITAPVIMLSRLQLRVVQATDVKGQYKFGDYFGARLISNFVALLIVIGILSTFAGRYSCEVCILILLVGVNKSIESTSDIVYGLMQKHERMDNVARSMVFRDAGAVILLAVIIKVTGNLLLGVTGVGLWWLLVLLLFDRSNAGNFAKFIPSFKLKKVLSLAKIGLPLGIVMGIISVNSNIPRYFVEIYIGSEALGYFGPLVYVLVGVSKATIALGQSASARLARYYVYNREAYVKLLLKILFIILMLAFGIILFGVFLGKPFLAIAYKPEYAERHDLFVWLMAASGVTMLASVLGYGMTAARRFKSQVPVLGSTCAVCLLACWLLVPRYGMKGAAWAMLLSATTQFLGSLMVVVHSLMQPARQEEISKRDAENG